MARRRFTVFSLAFLDVMSCGFGAVILIYLIINHSTEVEIQEVNKDILAEIRLLDYQVLNGEENLVELREKLEGTTKSVDELSKRLLSISEEIERKKRELDKLEKDSLANVEDVAALKADIESREQELRKLRALEEASDGGKARSFVGEGDRQYLTGLSVAGKRIFIAVDTSASMLDETIVNVIRRRNMKDERKRASPKWQRALRTVEWVASQVPIDSQFQLYGFNTEANATLKGTQGNWLTVSDTGNLDDAVNALLKQLPENGTSLEKLMMAMGKLDPLPDNVYLITDSLPTQGTAEPRRATISGKDRLKLFADALRVLPKGVRVNVILFPMEGDPLAAAAFWNLARTTGGAFMSPSKDWP